MDERTTTISASFGPSGSGLAANRLNPQRTTVFADATIHYRHDLLHRLLDTDASVPGNPDSLSDADLILLAYEAWGDRFVNHLEGDFALILWDGPRRRGLAAVDPVGARTLFFAPWRRTLALGSAVGAVRKLVGPDCLELNMPHVAEIAAGFWADSDDTCYQGIRRLLPGHLLSWTADRGVRIKRYWSLPQLGSEHVEPFPDAARTLRERLVAAVGDGIERHGRCAVWLSGGWDSTAVFASGQEWLRRAGKDSTLLRPISVSYPEGDPGREDELIQSVAAFWDVKPRWLDSRELTVFEDLEQSAAGRDEPWAHPFEHMNRALARGSRNEGASAAFSGNGGDILFASPIGQLSDLFWRARWKTLRREWVERRGRRLKTFFKAVVLPGTPRWGYELLRLLRRGHRIPHFLDRQVPPWFTSEYTDLLLERQWAERAWPQPGRVSRAEMEFYFRSASSPRLNGFLRRVALDAGVELESPMLDRRIIDHACARPASERSRGLETKLLLRASMEGLLPDEVLAPRASKTGLAGSFLTNALRSELDAVLDRLGNSMLLQEFGIVDRDSFLRSCERLRTSGGAPLASAIICGLHTEFWLRTHAT